MDRQSDLKAKHRADEAALDKLAYDQYPELSEDDVKTLVIDDKWLATLQAAINGERDRIAQTPHDPRERAGRPLRHPAARVD